MITFDLCCHREHPFEGWFRSRDDFQEQVDRALVECPLCGSTRIRKRLSAVAVHTGRSSGPPAPAAAEGDGAVRPQALLRAVQRFVEANFDDVGARFAAEALDMERGAVPARNIRGTTTEAEEQTLRDEGVEFLKVALPKYDA